MPYRIELLLLCRTSIWNFDWVPNIPITTKVSTDEETTIEERDASMNLKENIVHGGMTHFGHHQATCKATLTPSLHAGACPYEILEDTTRLSSTGGDFFAQTSDPFMGTLTANIEQERWNVFF